MSDGSDSRVLKVLVLGDPNCGKTSIIKRYVLNTFTPTHKPTVGVDFHLKQLLMSDRSVRVQLWDIAGQDKFGPISRVYYKDAVGAMLVYDITRPSTFETVIKWKEEIDRKVKLPGGKEDSNIPVVLIGNKSDLDEADTDSEHLDRFCEQHKFIGWFDTSAKLNINIDSAARFLVENILQHPEIFIEQRSQQASFAPGKGRKQTSPGNCC